MAEGPSLAARPGPPPLLLPGEGGVHTRAHLVGLERYLFPAEGGAPQALARPGFVFELFLADCLFP